MYVQTETSRLVFEVNNWKYFADKKVQTDQRQSAARGGDI